MTFGFPARRPKFLEIQNGSCQLENLENKGKQKKPKESKQEKQPLLLLFYCAIFKILPLLQLHFKVNYFEEKTSIWPTAQHPFSSKVNYNN